MHSLVSGQALSWDTHLPQLRKLNSNLNLGTVRESAFGYERPLRGIASLPECPSKRPSDERSNTYSMAAWASAMGSIAEENASCNGLFEGIGMTMSGASSVSKSSPHNIQV